MKFHISKLFWGLRAVVYKPFMKYMGIPSYMAKPIFIDGLSRISIGKRCRIFPGIRMEAMVNGSITIGNNVYIGQNCHITSEGSELKVGEGTDIMAGVCITNIDHNYQDIKKPILEQGYTVRITRIGKDCFIGQNAVIQAGVQLGDHVIVGANSVVKGEYPDYCVIVGSPARIVKKYNSGTGKWE